MSIQEHGEVKWYGKMVRQSGVRCGQLEVEEQNDVQFQFDHIYTQMSCAS